MSLRRPRSAREAVRGRQWKESAAMSLASRMLGRVLRMPKPLGPRAVVQRGVEVPMPDGVVLLAEIDRPQGGSSHYPTVLIRTPYGRDGILLQRDVAAPPDAASGEGRSFICSCRSRCRQRVGVQAVEGLDAGLVVTIERGDRTLA